MKRALCAVNRAAIIKALGAVAVFGATVYALTLIFVAVHERGPVFAGAFFLATMVTLVIVMVIHTAASYR